MESQLIIEVETIDWATDSASLRRTRDDTKQYHTRNVHPKFCGQAKIWILIVSSREASSHSYAILFRCRNFCESIVEGARLFIKLNK